MRDDMRKLLAEAIGTFVFFVIGAGSIVAGQMMYGGGPGVLGVALAHGIALALMVSSLGRISGGHFNPAVTAGIWMGNKISTDLAVRYIVAQLVGAVVAGLVLRGMFPEYVWRAVQLGTPTLGHGMGPLRGICIEALLTFFLAFAVYATAVDPKGPKIAGFGIGLMLFCDILVGAPLTGAAMNPARVFGPGLVSGTWDAHYVYWIGPMAGGLFAGWLYPKYFMEA